MKLLWCERAASDRFIIFLAIAEGDLAAADMVDGRIDATVRRLLDEPDAGRDHDSEANVRALSIDGTRFDLFYQHDGETISVLRILHRSRIWPDDILGR